ncbi:hypothetical protein PR202_ga05466 [Eleusine coracana subsp. coracana]|uniref:Uncharacterized protein n=1 Tax=Eleusine coracana subsp. coracana TaxID=191504 RepID=A0AAV5BRD1_ELECO|nr:hypothetical protein PR202_ga05013 [Eleusine coracana subsp. coracana]GJM89291.1 hypothetical protein PR202_ga05466 [Eleusine coracana subsp. coracana]
MIAERVPADECCGDGFRESLDDRRQKALDGNQQRVQRSSTSSTNPNEAGQRDRLNVPAAPPKEDGDNPTRRIKSTKTRANLSKKHR